MTDNLQQQIAALEAALAAMPPDAPARAGIEQMLTNLRAQQQPQTGGNDFSNTQIGTVENAIGGDAIDGDKVLGNKIVQRFYSGKPGEDGERLLRDYLRTLLTEHRRLRLGRLTEGKSGSGHDRLPPLALDDVVISLFTDGPPRIIHERLRPKARALSLAERLNRRDRSPDAVPPEAVREILLLRPESAVRGETEWISLNSKGEIQPSFDELPDNTPVHIVLQRPPLVSETLANTPRLVLLGPPGSGKSTVLRFLCLLLARRQFGDDQPLPSGWDEAPIPIYCPLGSIAAAMLKQPDDLDDRDRFWRALEQQLGEASIREGIGPHLRPALRDGAAMLLLDGLDEISATPDADGISLRARVSRAIQAAVRDLPPQARVVLTCRVLPYEQPPAGPRDDWTLPEDEGWVVRRLQPFAFGQVRRFVERWYAAACEHEHAEYSAEQGKQRAANLIAQLEHNPRLRTLVESPLLLTMLAILHYNKTAGELPRDRALLYDESVRLLLDRWEPQRTPEIRIPGLLERLGIDTLTDIEDLRAVLHRVAFTVHRQPPDPDHGRGLLRGAELTGEMYRFLERLRCDQISEKLAEFGRALRDEVGLLQEVGDDTYSFPHLTFQEYLAACDLADSPELIEKAYAVWSGPDGDRWREVLLLMAGRLRQQRTVERDGLRWLRLLYSEHGPNKRTKPPLQRQRDALLAADSYAEWEGRAALSSFDAADAAQIEQRLAAALVPLLETNPPLLPVEERVRAGQHLGRLGDPRPGVCDLNIDWCDVPAGPFLLGSKDDDEGAYDGEKPQRTVDLPGFRISRYPITNAQWQRFVDDGGYREQRWWSEAGWKRKEADGWPHSGGQDDPHLNGLNQPVVRISWYEATAFCRWLSAQLGYPVWMPSEAEWEKAARDSAGQIYPWGNEWDAEKANTSESQIGAPTPVGCYPDGVSPYGVLDMAGNVFEWTATPWQNSYQNHDGTERQEDDGGSFVWRGGAWSFHLQGARCAYRGTRHPSLRNLTLGVRVVAALTDGQ